ncbi:endonuclease/exonuclease/phosphatase family protein [Nocardioides panacis]|uniref:Endonuclease/exonuclease/phosphatase family protein n=1 Tax=Nocardioides panacis TaxID=2849501 RepID=A0A975T188_9ACTN|nr:endonuclease/exonuclease/phosphatase family protein [Nocardioides panacis]QWZ09734.1 endonuclease/exonuclease/phosphatase family protein [Nocardioides panacis]
MARVATWNLENLFRPGGGSGAPTTTAAYDAKLTALAGTIGRLDADVLAVQEVGDPAALQDLVDLLPGSWHGGVADPDGRGIRVGVISKLPLTSLEQVRTFAAKLAPVQVDDTGKTITQLGRPALRARVQAGGVDIDVVSVHLKSKLLSFPGDRFSPHDEDERARYAVYALHRRSAEAAGVRSYVTGLLDGQGLDRAVVVAGDLNDEPEAATTQVLLGPPGSEWGTPGYERPDAGDRARLWNLAMRIDATQRYSRKYRGRLELIDHLMVSDALRGKVTAVTAGDPDPAAPASGAHPTGGDVPSVTDNPHERTDAPGSDHRPVMLTLDL